MKFETFAKRLGKRIALIRQEKKITQVQLARDAGLSLKYVSMIEAGTNPSLRSAMKVCDALGADLAEVMSQEGIGARPGRKSAKLKGVQVDLEEDDPNMKKLLNFIRGLGEDDRRRALRLIRTTFSPR